MFIDESYEFVVVPVRWEPIEVIPVGTVEADGISEREISAEIFYQTQKLYYRWGFIFTRKLIQMCDLDMEKETQAYMYLLKSGKTFNLSWQQNHSVY